MIHQELIRLACENVEAYNAGDWERLKASLAPDVIYDEPGTQRQLQGADRTIRAAAGKLAWAFCASAHKRASGSRQVHVPGVRVAKLAVFVPMPEPTSSTSPRTKGANLRVQ
jgi:hypothetical protein